MATKQPTNNSGTTREDNKTNTHYNRNGNGNGNGNGNVNGDYSSSDEASLITTITKHTHHLITTTLLPPSRQQAIHTFILDHPLLTTFFICQILCSALPVCLLLAGVALSAAVAATVFLCIALFVFVPAVAVTTTLAVCLWMWLWCVVLGMRWAGRKYGVKFELGFGGREGKEKKGDKKEEEEVKNRGVMKVEEH